MSQANPNPNPRIDQASRLRTLLAAGVPDPQVTPASSTHVVAVVSGKGGVGKTFLAANTAIALAARNYRTILLDGDMGLANTDILLGIDPKGTWADVLQGRRELADVIVEAPGQVAFVPGCSGATEMANLSAFERRRLVEAIRQVEAGYDVMVLDCGAGISRNVIELTELADTVMVVATPEPTALADAYAMVKALTYEREHHPVGQDAHRAIGLVVNNAASRREGRETYERLAGVAARFLHVPVIDLGYVLRDEHVPEAVHRRRPVLISYPRCSASSCLLAVAGRLVREMGQPQVNRSLFYRVISLFV